MLRLIIPIKMFGKLVCYQGRDVTGTAEHKYKNPPESDFSRYLFNYDGAKQYSDVILTEGVFDAIRVGRNAVATFGKKISHDQRALILRAGWERVTIMFDSDAFQECVKFTKEMAQFIPTRIALIPKGFDPGSLEREQIQTLVSWSPYSDEPDFDSFMMRARLVSRGA